MRSKSRHLRSSRFIRFILILPFLLTLFAGNLVYAQEAITKPVGLYSVKISGKPVGASQARTYLGIQLLPGVVFSGVPSEVDGNVFSAPGIDSILTQIDPSKKYYLHVLSESGSGFISNIEEFRQGDILCTEDLTPWITTGLSPVSIRPHHRLIDVFGADNTYGLGSGTDADLTDNIVLFDPLTNQERIYYYHSTRTRWEEKGVEANANLASIYFPYGLYIVRRTSGDLRITLTGEVGDTSVLLPVRPGLNIFSLPAHLEASVNERISSTGDFSVIKGPNAVSSDLVTFYEPAASDLPRGPFYFSSRPNATGWREIGVNNSTAPTQRFDYLSTVVIRHNGPAGYIFAEANIESGALTPPPLEADLIENPLTFEGGLGVSFPQFPFNAGLDFRLESSVDLQTWTQVEFSEAPGPGTALTLPPGQSRQFYRIVVTRF